MQAIQTPGVSHYLIMRFTELIEIFTAGESILLGACHYVLL